LSELIKQGSQGGGRPQRNRVEEKSILREEKREATPSAVSDERRILGKE